MKIKKGIILVFILGLLNFMVFSTSVTNTKHNLSATGLGTIKTNETTMICVFCHVSHLNTSSAPRWSQQGGAPVYTLYDSSTLKSIPGQPDGVTKLCLSCHDGTIAMGPSRPYHLTDTSSGRIPSGKGSNLGQDLSDDHPVSFDPSLAVSGSTQLKNPEPNDPVHYDDQGKIQCTTCHSPHNDVYGNFLVKDNHGAKVCKTCHILPGYNGISTHDISTQVWNRLASNPWPHTKFSTVADNSCQNCHFSHGAPGKQRLLSASLEENVCLVCHNGNAGKDIFSVLKKSSGHPVGFYQGIHDPAENILSAANHVECVDCHNPHQLRAATTTAPNLMGRMEGVSGMSITGSLKKLAQFEYEVCLKCHGQDKYFVSTPIKRLFNYSNLRIPFNPANPSYHAVAATGKGTNIHSLKPPYNLSSRLYCTDCHTSDSGAAGPHGSQWGFILERRYEIGDTMTWSSAYYDLCFKCHDPNQLMNESNSGFKYHKKHVQEKNTPCSVCHDPHGSPNYIGLLNFDTNVVFPTRNGILKFNTVGNRGSCYLNCHGKEHNPLNYDR